MKLIEEGREPPRQLYEQPELTDFDAFYWEAFHELSSERQIGMGLGPIPRSAVMGYAAECGLLGDAVENFYDIIRRVDAEYLRLMNSSSKPERDNAVSVNDAQGTKDVMARIAARAKSASKPQRKDKRGNGQS